MQQMKRVEGLAYSQFGHGRIQDDVCMGFQQVVTASLFQPSKHGRVVVFAAHYRVKDVKVVVVSPL
jgi:hypothetical protein